MFLVHSHKKHSKAINLHLGIPKLHKITLLFLFPWAVYKFSKIERDHNDPGTVLGTKKTKMYKSV